MSCSDPVNKNRLFKIVLETSFSVYFHSVFSMVKKRYKVLSKIASFFQLAKSVYLRPDLRDAVKVFVTTF